ncbi:MAG: hypothetical protein IPM37_15185 [Hahellaceae bacterium]|nr:hypothetical protein [Hahellaceae bacterium]
MNISSIFVRLNFSFMLRAIVRSKVANYVDKHRAFPALSADRSKYPVLISIFLVLAPSVKAQLALAPEVSEWRYFGMRSEDLRTYPSHSAAIQGGLNRYNQCGDARIEWTSAWLDPQFNMGVEAGNTMHVHVAYCRAEDNGSWYVDGWIVMRNRSVQCPPGYSSTGYLCERVSVDASRTGSSCDAGLGIITLGNPINISAGIKKQEFPDLLVSSQPQIFLGRYYSSFPSLHKGRMGGHWSYSYSRRVVESNSAAARSVALYRDDGQVIRFTSKDGNWLTDAEYNYSLIRNFDTNSATTGWQVISPYNEVESYDLNPAVEISLEEKKAT